MGFFESLKRLATGKPIYTPDDVRGGKTSPQAEVPQPNAEPAAPAGPKYIPRLEIGRIHNNLQGNRLDMYAEILNESSEMVFLDSASMLGARRQLNSQLRPGERRQFLVYSGPELASQPSGYVELRYRKASDGDYFMEYFQIRSRQTEHGYEVEELRASGPVKDI